jgi:hypothetical protein
VLPIQIESHWGDNAGTADELSMQRNARCRRLLVTVVSRADEFTLSNQWTSVGTADSQ